MTQITIGAFSDKGVKQDNEDSYGVLLPEKAQAFTKGIAVAIADGMSGCPAAKEASETCVKCLLQDYFSTPDSWSVKKSASKILLATNSWMFGQGQNIYETGPGMVSTLSAMVLKSASAHIFHVGDSRISLFRDGNIQNLTMDHRYGRSHYLTRAMGTEKNLQIDYRVVDILREDVFILTTDGVHDFITTSDIKALITQNKDDLDRTTRLICEKALAGGSDDNLTCQIIRIEDISDFQEKQHLTAGNRLPFPPPLDSGMVLGGYRVLRELHANARSQVYLAEGTERGDLVALKTPSQNFDDDGRYMELFLREEWIGCQIKSPHILHIIPPREGRKFLYYVTEYIDGQTLREWITDHPAPDMAIVRDILRQLIRGLRSLHRLDMVHRDLKPENIMIDKAGTVKIIDFGSVKVASIAEAEDLNRQQIPAGAVDYTAPEYLLYADGGRLSDLYALGVVIYEMLTQSLPYGTGFSNMRQIRQLEYIPATQVKPDIPPWVDTVLKKAVQKDPRERYQSFSEFERDFTVPPAQEGKQNFSPLLEKNPLLFWRTLSFLLALLLVISLLWENN
ncbi:Serine/threonine protein kinase [hydrothermal vent metagenome]|uniref:Serine/threonine protein kinase n=1 Tax=hydrothermal vent metagenome TaxID=652676 RepID=A0A3B0RSM8_9ZZZZ